MFLNIPCNRTVFHLSNQSDLITYMNSDMRVEVEPVSKQLSFTLRVRARESLHVLGLSLVDQ